MHSRTSVLCDIGELLTATRSGSGGALVLRAAPAADGEALLREAAAQFTGGTVLRTRGVPAETDIPYSGLHALLRAVDVPPCTPLGRALRLQPGATDELLTGPVLAGLLTLLRRVAAEGPVLCLVADTHLLDPASRRAIGFAARRLGPPLPVTLLATTDREAPDDDLAGLPTRTPVRGVDELRSGLAELAGGVAGDAGALLREASRLLEPHEPEAAGTALLYAAEAAFGLGDREGCRTALDRLARLSPTAGDGLVRAYAEGMSAVLEGRFTAGTGPLRRAVALAAHEERPEHLLRSTVAALVLGELRAARETGSRALAAARVRGPAELVPRVLERLAYGELRTGRHGRAHAHASAGLRTAEHLGQRNTAAHLHAVLAMTAAVAGGADACVRHARAAGEAAGPHGLGVAATLAQWALARQDLGHGHVHEAAERLRPLIDGGPVPTGPEPGGPPGQGHFTQRMLAVPCFVEAAVLAGAPEEARTALGGFAQWTAVMADPLAPAQLARCRALLAEDPDEADTYFALAVAEHARAEGEFERARTLLLYGKSLRRRRRPGEARGLLHTAHLAFERCGARPWAGQAEAELRATGSAAARRPASLSALTPQQLRIARQVAEGATNREVAVRLSVSPRTVDHHLRNTFAALGVRSRVELARVLAAAEGPDAA